MGECATMSMWSYINTVSIDCKWYWCKYLCVHSCMRVRVYETHRRKGERERWREFQVYETCFTCCVSLWFACVWCDAMPYHAICDCIILRALLVFYFVRCNKIQNVSDQIGRRGVRSKQKTISSLSLCCFVYLFLLIFYKGLYDHLNGGINST